MITIINKIYYFIKIGGLQKMSTQRNLMGKELSSRERVIKSLNHEEPDRVPIDMGSTFVCGIMAQALDNLRKYLGLPDKKVKVYDIFQMLGEVEIDVIERLNLDILPIEALYDEFFNFKRDNYKAWKLMDGTEVLMPGQFNVEVDNNGDWLLHEKADINKPVVGIMPKNGFYFDKPSISGYDLEFTSPSLESIKKENHLTNEELEYITSRAEKLRKSTDKALFLNQWLKLSNGWVGSIPNFLELLYLDRKYIKNLFDIRTETALKNLEKLKKYLKDNIDIIGLENDDFGMQTGEFFSPAIFEEFFLPAIKIKNDWIHENTNWKTFQHSCGSIVNLIPMIIEAGTDILNPIQTSARGMDPKLLKDKFGEKITFWGG